MNVESQQVTCVTGEGSGDDSKWRCPGHLPQFPADREGEEGCFRRESLPCACTMDDPPSCYDRNIPLMRLCCAHAQNHAPSHHVMNVISKVTSHILLQMSVFAGAAERAAHCEAAVHHP